MKISDTVLAKIATPRSDESINYIRGDLAITPKRVAKFLVTVVIILTIAHVIGTVFKRMPFEQTVFTRSFSYLFDLVGENNIPAIFSFALLLVTAILLYYIGQAILDKKKKKYWKGLSIIFVFLALDEILEIHEKVDSYIRLNHFNDVLNISEYVWVIPYSLLVLIVGLLYLKFVLQLPPKIRNLFFITGSLYVFAAIGIDSIQGFIQMHELNHFYYWLLTTIEEPIEMCSIILFIYALLNYISPIDNRIYIKTKQAYDSQVDDDTTQIYFQKELLNEEIKSV
jgi:hypothetical protein